MSIISLIPFKRATAMALVWQYGEKSGYESWKGLSWGMVSAASFPCSNFVLQECVCVFVVCVGDIQLRGLLLLHFN